MKTPDPITVKEPIALFQEKAADYIKACQAIVNRGIIAQNTFDVDCSFFEDIYKDKHDVRYDSPFECMFQWLTEYGDYPCLYRWELIPPYDTDKIKSEISSLKEKGYNVPYVNPNARACGHTLYIGKAQSCIWGRQIEHLGYHTQNQGHHGLHLHDWAKDMKLNLKLYVFVFPKECVSLLEIFEREFAKEWKPLIGSHK